MQKHQVFVNVTEFFFGERVGWAEYPVASAGSEQVWEQVFGGRVGLGRTGGTDYNLGAGSGTMETLNFRVMWFVADSIPNGLLELK